ncbi:MAG: leucine--tRNA ligase [Lachnospiraceae bacterium]|nr:leucine--tRNA ligase [Lachnospiraceae bacterium]
MKEYVHSEVEKKWQDIWDREEAFCVSDDHSKPKYYALVEFPYPSGQGLHVGHPRPYTAMDIVARKRRMQGYNVLFPMGWDAFGLPTENYAIKEHIHPKIVTENNVSHFKEQLHALGYSFDWNREVNTTDPSYYKWTQWIFLKLFEHGLAYKAEVPINWCTGCKVSLANEEVVDGVCERCGSPVVRRVKSQWMLKITEYADKLLEGLDTVDYIEKIKTQQRNWIGRSTGAEVDFGIAGTEDILRVFTTRCDTLFGATYMVVAPEHPLIEKYADRIGNMDEIRAYRDEANKKSDFERAELSADKEKTGVRIEGLTAVNPVNNTEIPIYVSDYVLMSYGTGAIMAVPAHDTRDWAFAKKFGLPIIEVVSGSDKDVNEECYPDVSEGIMVNSGFIDGLNVKEAQKKMIGFLEKEGKGREKVNFKLRDWIFSRQRYWGEPIPIVHCEKCGYVAVPYDELPLMLPEVESYEPTDTGESPLSKMESFVNCKCPKCGGPGKRETDTMPQWAGSSWYFLRYCDPHNDDALASEEALKYWMPVDWYNGGMEHTTLHLLYSRFWHRFLYDIGAVTCPEPYLKRTSHGLILGSNNEKMSKSRGNVVNPDDIVRDYGADTLRLYEMFIGAFDMAASWSDEGVKGCRRFLDRVWRLQDILVDGDSYSQDMETRIHQTIKKVSGDFDTLKYNTGIAALMSLLNDFTKKGSINKAELSLFLVLLNPVAPHITEEMWELIGNEGRVYRQTWPSWDEEKTVEDTVEIMVQVNGKNRKTISVARDIDKDSAIAAGREAVAEWVDGHDTVKEIFVPGRLVNIVVK